MKEKIRREKRAVSRNDALAAADSCNFAVLSVIDTDGQPYGVALSVVRDGGFIYFHSATDGFKAKCMRNNPNGCMVCVSRADTDSENYTVKYSSAVIRGTLSEVTDDTEKAHALRLLCLKYTPDDMDKFGKALKDHLPDTAVWKMTVSSITGKCNK